MVIDGDTVLSKTNNLATMLRDVKVYGGNPWCPVQDGKIRKLILKTQEDNICVCQAKDDNCGKSKIKN